MQISLALIFVINLPLEIRVVHIALRKKLKISIFSKMAPTSLIKFSEFIVHSKPSNMTLSALSEKMHEIRKLYKFREDK